MNFCRYIILTIITLSSFLSCKKEPVKIDEPKVEVPEPDDSPTITYTKINRKLKVSDINAMTLDVNNDGIIDCSYFMQYVMLDGKVHLYAGVNPVFGSATSSTPSNDNVYLNMGTAHSFDSKQPIKNDLPWTENHSLLSDRIEEADGSKTYSGNWSGGQEKMMSIRLLINGKMHYAWAQLKFDKATEELVLIDAAWNTIAEQEIKAGAR